MRPCARQFAPHELPQPEVQVCSNGSRQRRQICSIVDHILKPNCNAAAPLLLTPPNAAREDKHFSRAKAMM